MSRDHALGIALALFVLGVGLVPVAAAEQLQVTLVKLTSPVYGGEQVTLTIRTTTGAECRGIVRYRTTQGTLSSKTAGDDGTVSWSWRVGADARGSYPVEVQCTQGDKRGGLMATLEVK